MAAVRQGLDQICNADYPEETEEKYSFRSCINLEENAKNNIIHNAQLRIMRMETTSVYAHPSTRLNHDL